MLEFEIFIELLCNSNEGIGPRSTEDVAFYLHHGVIWSVTAGPLSCRNYASSSIKHAHNRKCSEDKLPAFRSIRKYHEHWKSSCELSLPYEGNQSHVIKNMTTRVKVSSPMYGLYHVTKYILYILYCILELGSILKGVKKVEKKRPKITFYIFIRVNNLHLHWLRIVSLFSRSLYIRLMEAIF